MTTKTSTTRPAVNWTRVLTASILIALPLAGPQAHGAGFDLADGESTAAPVAAVAPSDVDWARARVLPAAFLFAASEARREQAAAVSGLDQLRPDGEGAVDLSLSTVIDLTLRNNADLRVSSYVPALSEENLKAREAIYDPLLRFTLSLLSSTSPTSASLEGAEVLTRKQGVWNFSGFEQLPWGGNVAVGFDNSRDKTNNRFATLNPAFDSGLSFSLTQPLLRDFGRAVTEREIRIARNDREASRELFREAVMNKVTLAADSYWNLYGQRENLAVQRAGLSLANDLLRINKTRVEVGTMAPLDIALAEAEVARNQQGVIAAEHDVKTAEDRIRNLVNLPRDSPIWQAGLRPVDLPSLDQGATDVDRAIETAFARRPELRRQDLTIKNDQIRLDYAKNQKKPALNLQASYGVVGLGGDQIERDPITGEVISTLAGGYGDALDQLFSFDFDNWRIAAVVEFPLFNKLAEANHASALLVLRQGEDQLENARQTVALEVRRLVREVDTSKRQIEASGVTRRAQEKRLDAESKKFEHGLSTNFEVQQAQKDVTEARSNEVQAITSYRRSLNALELVTGTVLETYGVRVQE